MLQSLTDLYAQASKWSNDNQGVVSVAIFAITLGLGWASGIFGALRRRPKFKIGFIEGPTFCCTYSVGKTHGEYEVHRTGFALYLVVANVGSAASSIQDIALGYHWHLRPYSRQWLRYSIGWFWLSHQTAALTDFRAKIGGNLKIYPFLFQRNFLSPVDAKTYLEVGQSTNGLVYFEQEDSWGGGFPTVGNGKTVVKVKVRDVFGKSHTAKMRIPSISFERAREYNPSFGKTLAELRGEELPHDQSV